MPAERAGYTVTMFLVDTSPSMRTLRTVELPPGPNEEYRSTEMTNLQWALQFVKLKVQEMIFNGRKTDQCGVIVFGSEETDNVINEKNGGYDNVKEFIPIAQPGSGTLAKLDTLRPSTVTGDPIDALIVGIETQAAYLANKKTWTRKIVIITDGENPIEVEDWEATVRKMDALDISLTIVGVDFDDPDFSLAEPNKTVIKKANEEFYKTLTSHMKNGLVGTCALALRETTKPDIKQTRSTLMGTILRLGDTETKPEEALEILVKTSKCTSVTRPKGWKKFSFRVNEADEMEVDEAVQEKDKIAYVQLRMRTEYYVDRTEHDEDSDSDIKMEDPDGENLLDATNAELKDTEAKKDQQLEKVEKEDLIRGFKYGTTYAPCPDGQFPKLPTRKGIDICGFFSIKNFRRELSMGEVQYIWADPTSPQQQVALSSIVQAMYEKNVMAIARWVSKDGMDPKMGVLYPSVFDKVECLLWAQMPFADDVRKYTFASLDHLVSKKGEVIQQHPYLPTDSQLDAMENFVDAMDLMAAGDKDEEGCRGPWFETLQSYNPAVHRIKQALFHAAVVSDITTNPLPPPHPELVKYFEPPRKVLKRAREAIEECKTAFKVKQVPKRVAKARKDGHVHAQEEDENLLLDRKAGQTPTHSPVKGQAKAKPQDSDTEEDEEDTMLLEKKGPSTPVPENRRANGPLPTPVRSISPEIDPGRAPGRIIGTTFPLKDFQKNTAQGDVVSKAVEDLGAVIVDIAMRPFAKRRNTELIECMKVLRDTCLKEDEIDTWNAFLKELKDKCLDKPGNLDLWTEVRKMGRNISLIGKDEARKQGGTSTISEQEAMDFVAGQN